VEKSDSEPKSVRASGRTIEDAIQNGLAELDVPRDQVEVELLNGVGDDPERPVLVQLSVREDDSNLYTPTNLAPSAVSGEPAPVSPETTNEPQDIPTTAKSVLETLLRGMGIRSQVVIHHDVEGEEGPDFVLDIVGADLGILIGRRGETLRDLEYIARLIVTSKTHSNDRFAVDVEGYRARRERVLRELAKRMADRVKQNRQPITLEAMPPNERRIVHITLKEHPTVKTQSIGEGERRRVMILPK
jgi:spoIIIJ-associated protein